MSGREHMKVSNMTGSSGREIPNQFIIEADDAIYFQSYKSMIAKKQNGKVFLDSYYWDYSRTTGKYRNLFLGETKAETQKKINSGEYKLINLN